MKSKIKVLIADSDDDFSLLAADMLAMEEDFEIVGVAADGEQALKLFDSAKPDVLLVDLVLPKLDGLGLIRRLNEMDISASIFVISALYNQRLIARCAELGVYYFIPKPCDMTELMVRIRQSRGISALPTAETTLRRGRLESTVSAVLHEIGVPAHIKGYQYLREAIILAINDMDLLDAVTKELYPAVAKRFSTTSPRVERAIRHAIELAWERGDIETLQSFFGYTVSIERGKPTNSEFIAMIADSLSIRYMASEL